MILIWFLVLVHREVGVRSGRVMVESYKQRRDILLGRDKALRLGSDVILDPYEKIVNEQLMENKKKEMARYLSGEDIFPPGESFTEAKKIIEKSKVYQFIRKMPKGGLLHIHDFALTSVQWLVSYATYLPHCYLCQYRRRYNYHFSFSATRPVSTQDCVWSLVADERNRFKNGTEAFDDMLVRSILLDTSKVLSSRRNTTRIWKYFEQYFSSVTGLILYNPVFPVYVYQGLKELWEDNIQHFEIRASFQQTYSVTGRHSSSHTVLQQYIRGIRRFQKLHCHSCRVQLIICLHRSLPATKIRRKLFEAAHLQRMYPDWVAGFDLVGQEDGGRSLLSIVTELKGFHLPFFFHAGETNWQGTASDENLVDALLLRVRRIGHGYAILKHPAILELARLKEIPIEVCPISNQILGLLNDLRNHPASALIAGNFPIVVSSDDPATWESTGLSHDMYVIFMAVAGAHDDLRLLKKLALNSIRFSSLPQFQKQKLQDAWTSKWRHFIENEALSTGVNTIHHEMDFPH